MTKNYDAHADEWATSLADTMKELLKDTKNPVDYAVDVDSKWKAYIDTVIGHLKDRGLSEDEAKEKVHNAGGLVYNYYIDFEDPKEIAWILSA